MHDFQLRRHWIERVPSLKIQSTWNPLRGHDAVQSQHLITYEPGDCTRYVMSVVPAHWASWAEFLGTVGSSYWQLGVWSGSSNGTMLVPAGSSGSHVADPGWIIEQLRCSEYAAGVFGILIHGCLASHSLKVAQELIAQLREYCRKGFVDPDATDQLREK